MFPDRAGADAGSGPVRVVEALSRESAEGRSGPHTPVSLRAVSAVAPRGAPPCSSSVRCTTRGAVSGTATAPGTPVAVERGSRVAAVPGRGEGGEGAQVGAVVAQGGTEGTAVGRRTQVGARQGRVGGVQPAGVHEVARAQPGYGRRGGVPRAAGR
ncbi:hypothetical protein SSTG_05424 [Streptomyces sp. e14]|nr:hypothetical protein SSTG_05424 [Streptomyces sp. e14]